MPPPGRFRVSIGDLVGFVALVGLVLAPRLRNLQADYAGITFALALNEMAMVGVFFFNRSVSRWCCCFWILRSISLAWCAA